MPRRSVHSLIDRPKPTENASTCTPRQRAVDLFSRLGIWDTEHNNGVLIYLLMAEHDVEIVADRGIASRVSPEEWETICRSVLARHFPSAGGDRNEQPNRPVLL